MFSMINRLTSSSSWRGKPRKRARRAHWGPETLEIRAVPAVDLAGSWVINGQAASIAQSGTSLVFTNEHGDSSTGTFINNETQVQANDWGNLVGTLVGTSRIEWANGSVWTRDSSSVPDISGSYTINGQNATVVQNGTSLTFTNEHGMQSSGTFLSNTQVQATQWGNLVGNLVGDQIRWANGSVWTKGSVTINPPDVSGEWTINGRTSSIVQSGANVVLTNEHGNSANGVFINNTQIRADGWGGLIGTLTADTNTINWANGSVWNRAPDVSEIPDLAGVWNINGFQTSISQNGASLVFTNEFGNSSTGSVLSETQVRADTWNITGTLSADANRIQWSNGSVWTRGDAVFPDIAGRYSVNNGSSLTASVQQNGRDLTFVNERGESSPGFFNSATEVTASAWFNLQGDLVGNQIRWGNGTVWTRIS